MKMLLKKLDTFFSRKKKDTGSVPHINEEQHEKNKKESLKYIEKHFGRALTRLSER